MKRYWKLKEEALNYTHWRNCMEKAYGPVVRQIMWRCVTF
jgi:hypothetical protein